MTIQTGVRTLDLEIKSPMLFLLSYLDCVIERGVKEGVLPYMFLPSFEMDFPQMFR